MVGIIVTISILAYFAIAVFTGRVIFIKYRDAQLKCNGRSLYGYGRGDCEHYSHSRSTAMGFAWLGLIWPFALPCYLITRKTPGEKEIIKKVENKKRQEEMEALSVEIMGKGLANYDGHPIGTRNGIQHLRPTQVD